MMLWGAVLGFVILGAFGQIEKAWHHRGAGYVTYEQPDRTEAVSESEYKRHKYVMGAMMLALGLLTWILVAKFARDASEKSRRTDQDS